MIRTVKIPRLGCAPGGNCCNSCSNTRLGDTSGSDDSTSNALWLSLAAIVGGFFLAATAAGKLKVSR